MLVGKLSSCKGVLATPEDRSELSFYRPLTRDPALVEAAIAATRALPKYKELQADWEKIWRALPDDERGDGHPGDWDSDEPDIDVFGTSNGPQFAIVRYGNDYAEAMPAELLVLFHVDASGMVTPLRQTSSSIHPQLLIDVNADGIPEILSHQSLYGLSSHGSYLIQEVQRAYNGCSC
jgi:hypothetical protein